MLPLKVFALMLTHLTINNATEFQDDDEKNETSSPDNTIDESLRDTFENLDNLESLPSEIID